MLNTIFFDMFDKNALNDENQLYYFNLRQLTSFDFFFFSCRTKHTKEGMLFDAKCLVSDQNQLYYFNLRQLHDEKLL